MTTTILLADDHKLLREGIRSLIVGHQDMTIVAEAADGKTTVQLAAELTPDIILMDISMAGMDGIEATRQILARNPRIKIIALSMHLDKKKVIDMLNAGASGYLLKDCAFEELVHAVRTVAASIDIYLSPMVTEVVLKDVVKRPGQETPEQECPALSVLTPREREILRLLVEGKNTKEIAELLGVTVKTAEFHRTRIMKKLDVRNIAELVLLSVRKGFCQE